MRSYENIKVLYRNEKTYPNYASAGVDFEAAERLGIKAIRALSLPGKVAPDTAGDIIKDTILNILEETEAIE